MPILPWVRAAQQSGVSALPVAIISLPDQHERRRLLIERGIPRVWVETYWPATDLRNADITALDDLVDVEAYPQFSGEQLRPAVVGCATSHRRLAQWLAATDLPLLLVLEDDVVPISSDIDSAVLDVVQQLGPAASRGEAFVCHLGTRPEQFEQSLRRPLKLSKPGQTSVQIWLHIDPRPTIWRAHAYLLSRGAALRSLEREKRMRTVADDWIRRRDLGLIDHLYLVSPRIFRQDETLVSTLGIPPGQLAINLHADFLQRGIASLKYRLRFFTAKVLHQRPFRPGHYL